MSAVGLRSVLTEGDAMGKVSVQLRDAGRGVMAFCGRAEPVSATLMVPSPLSEPRVDRSRLACLSHFGTRRASFTPATVL